MSLLVILGQSYTNLSFTCVHHECRSPPLVPLIIQQNDSSSPDDNTTIAPKDFRDLPSEIRDHIYRHLLRPGQDPSDEFYGFGSLMRGVRVNAVGCTKVLVLNKETYSEAMAIMEKMTNHLHLEGAGRKSFRHPLANGKPSFFHSWAPSSATFVPDMLSELEFVNLRNVTVWIKHTTSSLDILDVTHAIRKSHTLREIHLKCQIATGSMWGSRGSPHVSTTPATLQRLRIDVRSLIFCCIERKIKLTAETDCYFKNSELSRNGASRYFRVDTYRDAIAACVNDFGPLISANVAIDEAQQERLSQGLDEPLRQYVPTPECRHCYAVFEKQEDLQAHLEWFPRHQVPYVKKKYNKIHPFATAGGDRHACLVCGCSFNSRTSLDHHTNNQRHHRDRKEQGVVPRYAKDNKWYKCTGPVGAN